MRCNQLQLQLLLVACKNQYRIRNTIFALLPAGTSNLLHETKHYSSVSSVDVNFTCCTWWTQAGQYFNAHNKISKLEKSFNC